MTFSENVATFIIGIMQSGSFTGSLRMIDDKIRRTKYFTSPHRGFLLLLLYLLLLVLNLLQSVEFLSFKFVYNSLT